MAKKVLTDQLLEPLNGETAAMIDIHVGDGNLTIDRTTSGEQVLASGTLQYLENQSLPARSLVSKDGRVTFTLRGSRASRPWFHFPWSACNGATEWQIHLNPVVASDITARSNGGNVRLELGGLHVTQLSAGTGGGNMDVVLPDGADKLAVTVETGAGNVSVEIGSGFTGSNSLSAKSGAGNVIINLPSGLEARIQATSGLGKVIVDPLFQQVDKTTYQSAGFDSADNKVEITLSSGAGNVKVYTRS
jgi:hypothetical protein